MDQTANQNDKKESLRLTLLNKIYELMTAAFSLVAALAWNDAIQTFFSKIFGNAGTLWAKFLYAVFITLIVVWLGIKLGRTAKAMEKILTKKQTTNNS